MAMIGDLVPREHLASAVALNSMTFNLARAIGPPLAAVSVRVLGIPASFAINSGSYLAARRSGCSSSGPRRAGWPRAARPGCATAFGSCAAQPQLLAFLLIVTAVGFASDPVNTEAPAFAHAFGRPDTDGGYLIGAFGAGAVAAAFLLAGRVAGSRRRMLATLVAARRRDRRLLASCRGSPVGFVFLAVAGFGYLASNTSATSRLQLGVEEHQRGRIMALWSVAFLGLRPVASLTDGALASAFGVRVAGVVPRRCPRWPASRRSCCSSGAALLTRRSPNPNAGLLASRHDAAPDRRGPRRATPGTSASSSRRSPTSRRSPALGRVRGVRRRLRRRHRGSRRARPLVSAPGSGPRNG